MSDTEQFKCQKCKTVQWINTEDDICPNCGHTQIFPPEIAKCTCDSVSGYCQIHYYDNIEKLRKKKIMQTKVESGGLGFFGALAIVFIILKLTHVVAWSWLWVLAPIWIPLALGIGVVVLFIMFAEW